MITLSGFFSTVFFTIMLEILIWCIIQEHKNNKKQDKQ